jgi:hypothetical protein
VLRSRVESNQSALLGVGEVQLACRACRI